MDNIAWSSTRLMSLYSYSFSIIIEVKAWIKAITGDYGLLQSGQPWSATSLPASLGGRNKASAKLFSDPQPVSAVFNTWTNRQLRASLRRAGGARASARC